MVVYFFFFKQKTAYEMRISDWSSDVCSSDLFGHTRGAFTGAISDMPGKIRLADKSTLFLDEIGELDDQNQAKLLRVIETKEVFAVGGNRGMRCDVRFMAATNRDVSPESDGPLDRKSTRLNSSH